MDFADFRNLLGKPKKAPPPAPAKPARRASERRAKAPVHQSEHDGIPAKKYAQSRIPIVSKKSELPNYLSCVSHETGPIRLHEEQRRDYVLILRDTSSKKVDVLVSQEAHAGEGRMSARYDIKHKIEASGYVLNEQVICARALIGLVYEDHQASGMTVTLEAASEMQREFDALLKRALTAEASDIHLEVRPRGTRIRMREHGVLMDHGEASPKTIMDMARVAYNVMAGIKDLVFDPKIPQDAEIERVIDGVDVRVRLATGPAFPGGFDMVLRLLRMGAGTVEHSLASLGYLPEQRVQIKNMMKSPVGLILICGVTGSGKSTTLNVMLSMEIKEANGQIKVITVENPPEYILENATQMPVATNRDAEGKDPFAKYMKAAMRLDPDILMIGEVRDPETAKLAAAATQSGHQAFATLHAPGAFSAQERLKALQITENILGSEDFFAGIIYQSLIPTTCKKCSIPLDRYTDYNNTEEGAELVARVRRHTPAGRHSNIRMRNYSGCASCKLGIAGRTVVAETVKPNAQLRRYWKTSEFDLAKAYFLSQGGRLILHIGVEKIAQGLCCPTSVEGALGPLDQLDEYMDLMTTFGLPPLPDGQQGVFTFIDKSAQHHTKANAAHESQPLHHADENKDAAAHRPTLTAAPATDADQNNPVGEQ